jgi:flavin-dependent dehydrogenase
MEVFTSGEGISSAGFVEHTAVFDFTPITCGVQGYYWDFPAIQRGTPTMNRGLFDARVRPDRPRARLKPVFEGELAGRGVRLHEVPLLGHPERWFDAREPQAGPRVVLAGDAAGAEPLLGEGISYALNFGVVAAEAVIDAFAREDFSFSGYNRRVMRSALGRHLRLKRFVAHYAYGKRGRWFYRLGWRTLGLLVRVHGLSGRGCEVAKL